MLARAFPGQARGRAPAGARERCSNTALDVGNENHYHFVMDVESRRTDQRDRAPAPLRDAPPRISSRRLLGERGELVIEHEGREYRLRLTQNRKLILTA